jgi:REP element-mobilizing transposase RayT
MRREEQGVDTFHHIILRSAHGVKVFYKNKEKWVVLTYLFYKNDSFSSKHWKRELKREQLRLFERPADWPPRDPFVKIMAFCIHSNHIHLLVKQIREGGLTEFMRRLPNGISNWHKEKYGNQGNIFQPYASRMVENENDLAHLALYVMIKNVFERYPDGGIEAAYNDLEKVWQWALSDPFSSFPDYAGYRNSPVVEKDMLADFYPAPKDFKEYGRDYIQYRREREKLLQGLLLE